MLADDLLEVVKKMDGLLLEQIRSCAMLVNEEADKWCRWECAYQ
jgi:hypothetical protein